MGGLCESGRGWVRALSLALRVGVMVDGDRVFAGGLQPPGRFSGVRLGVWCGPLGAGQASCAAWCW